MTLNHYNLYTMRLVPMARKPLCELSHPMPSPEATIIRRPFVSIKRVGGLLFVRIGRVGGSFYISK